MIRRRRRRPTRRRQSLTSADFPTPPEPSTTSLYSRMMGNFKWTPRGSAKGQERQVRRVRVWRWATGSPALWVHAKPSCFFQRKPVSRGEVLKNWQQFAALRPSQTPKAAKVLRCVYGGVGGGAFVTFLYDTAYSKTGLKKKHTKKKNTFRLKQYNVVISQYISGSPSALICPLSNEQTKNVHQWERRNSLGFPQIIRGQNYHDGNRVGFEGNSGGMGLSIVSCVVFWGGFSLIYLLDDFSFCCCGQTENIKEKDKIRERL